MGATSTLLAGAGEGNRTLVVSLEGFCSTIELHPQGSIDSRQLLKPYSGGGGWIRTNVGVSQQIYSLPPLATRAPLRRERIIMTAAEHDVKHCASSPSVDALTYTCFARAKAHTPASGADGGGCGVRSLTITYFHTGNPHYHRRGVVSRSCSGWEGVVPTRYGHQA